ncbi:MAG: ABC transporter ATP-binding protein [Patescibacteria group bacterium]|nr:ABC transporter ATP-binding protein [Patescibacteria group bacterium]
MEPIIEIKNIGKKYNIIHERGGYVTFRDVITNVIMRPLLFAKTKAMRAVGLEKKEEYWALRDISLNVNRGEVIGIIGANGAGKSTLLKILSQITPPTEGEIVIRGTIGSLLEVGTGFHPELTGRENIFLNGAILGMTRAEIAKKFDAIVEFAGISKFIDTPVKRYSSGMYVRLAFSVAAHMEPDILLVDEVLAVGDAEFQKKCLGKMEEVTEKNGRTIIFVSHNMGAIEQLCDRSILLKNGRILRSGPTREIVSFYMNNDKNLKSVIEYPQATSTKGVSIKKVSILDDHGNPSSNLSTTNEFSFEIEYEVFQETSGVMLNCIIYSEGEILLNWSDADSHGKLITYDTGIYKTKVTIPSLLLNNGFYYAEVSIKRPGIEFLDRKQNISFEMKSENDPRNEIYNNQIPGKIIPPLKSTTQKI